MDPTERVFKLGLDVAGFLALFPLLRRLTSAPYAVIAAFLGSHTLNFLFNGQIYGVLKHFGGPRRTWDDFDREVQGMQSRIAAEPSILYAAAYGSLARSQWSPTSDLDVRLVRAPGLGNAWRACWFAVRERTRALVRRFPLDLLILDSDRSLNAMAEKDTPVVLHQANGRGY